MKKIVAISVLALLGFTGAYKANAQQHNMGLQMSMIWPKGGGYTKSFNSLYGGLFYEYRFQGKDEDVNELMDHFGLEFGLNYTEFIFKNNWLYGASNISVPSFSFVDYFGSNSPYTKLSNKGVNFYTAPKVYVTIYPELVELYLMGKLGYQYLNTSGTISPRNSNVAPWKADGGSSSKVFYGAAIGFEVKLGTVSVGTNFGFDTNSPYKIMRDEIYKQQGVTSPIEIYPFKNMDKIWGNLLLEFKIKAQLNPRD